MKTNLFVRALSVMAALALIGLPWLSEPALALEGVTFYSNPGPTANGTTATMTCGWHNTCEPPNEIGQGLDWQNSPTAGVHFQGWGYRSAGGNSPLLIGTVYIGQRNGSCTNAVADIVDPFGNYIGRVNYTHSQIAVPEGSSSYIYGKSSGYFNQRTYVATTIYASAELGGCPIDGSHLHQSSSNGAWNKFGSYPNEDGARYRPYDITSVYNAMYYVSWDA